MGKPALPVSPGDACGEFEVETEGELDADADAVGEVGEVESEGTGLNDGDWEFDGVSPGEVVKFGVVVGLKEG